MKFRIQLALTALAALAIMVAACSQTPSVDHYPTFSQAMDHLVGAGNWSAQSHTNGKDGLLTVSGVTLKLPGAPTAAQPVAPPDDQPVYTGSDGTVETSPTPAPKVVASGEQQVVEIATVEVKKPLDQKALTALIATADWKNQKETKLADSVVLKGISQKVSLGKDIFEAKIEEASVRAVTLSASGADAPAGRAGFLKALRLSDLGYKNFVMNIKSKEINNAKVGIAQVAVQGVAFDGEPMAGIEALDPSGLTGVMTSMSAKSASIKGMSMDIEDEKKLTLHMSVALVDEKDIKAMGAIGDMNMEGLKLEMIDEQKKATAMTMNLAKLNLRGFDMSAYMQKMMPIAIAASIDPAQADQLVYNLYTLGDIFVSPFSLDEFSLSGLEANFADLVTVKMAEAKASGPYRAGQMPVTQKSSLSGLEVILPEDGQKTVAADKAYKSLYEFGQKFGMTRFMMDFEGEGSYDAASGKVVSRLTRLTIKDLLEISGSGEMGGLTAERVEKLNKTTLNMAKMALLVPDEILGDVAVHNLNMKLEDKGLTNRILAFAAQAASEKNGGQVSADDIRQQVLAAVPILVTMQGGDYLANPEALAQSLTAFFKAPGSLEIKMAAQPPVGLKSVMEMGFDPNQILNSLNISLSANGQEAPPLKFAITK